MALADGTSGDRGFEARPRHHPIPKCAPVGLLFRYLGATNADLSALFSDLTSRYAVAFMDLGSALSGKLWMNKSYCNSLCGNSIATVNPRLKPVF